MMYYLPDCMKTPCDPHWPKGRESIPVELLPDGTAAALPVLPVNTLILGKTNSGKTRSLTIPLAKKILDTDPKTRCVFFEIKTTFVDRFMEDKDKVISHDPGIVPQSNLFRPNIIREVRQSRDREAEMREFAECLFAELTTGAGQNLAWAVAARDTFIGVLRVIVDCLNDNTTNRVLIGALRSMPVKDLLAYLSKHPRNHALLRLTWGYEPSDAGGFIPSKRTGDILFFLNTVLEKFSGSFVLDGMDTIHDWLNGKYGRHLFFLYDLASAEISRPFFLYYLKKIKDYKMSNSAGISAPLLLVLDEADKMAEHGKAADWGVFQAANLGRESGLQIILTTQSVENLYGLSPDYNEHVTLGGLAGFPNIFAFTTGDPKTIETLAALFGSEYKEHLVMPVSRYSTPVIKYSQEQIVTDGDLNSLKTGECYVKIMDSRPQKIRFTEWA